MNQGKSAYNMLQDALSAIEKRLFKRADARAADKGARVEERLSAAEAKIADLERRLAEKEK